jgi:glycine/D-amino acid oxidase-like deaminating enzyme
LKKYNYLIVGQGLAGTVLAYTLLKRKQRICVIDDGYKNSASKVAVGMFNPVTGKRIVKTWKADLIFPFLHTFYSELETFLRTKFFFPKTIYRPFESIEQQNHVLGQSVEEGFADFISLENNDEKYKSFVFNQFGGIEIKNGGYVDVSKMLDAFRDFLVGKNLFLEMDFDENELTSGIAGQAEKIIFCCGIKDQESKFWKQLPFKAVKGEVLIGDFQEIDFQEIINRSGWVLPFEHGIYKAGTTYDWDDRENKITEQAQNEILDKTRKLIKADFRLEKQEVGIRPTTSDRRPLIGMHPNYAHIGIFNGLGTKGVMLAPYFANHFADFLLENKPLDREVSIERC